MWVPALQHGHRRGSHDRGHRAHTFSFDVAQRLQIRLRFTCFSAALHIQPLHTCPISTTTRPTSLPTARPISKAAGPGPISNCARPTSTAARPTSTAARPISNRHHPISSCSSHQHSCSAQQHTAARPSAQPLRRCMVPAAAACSISTAPRPISSSSNQQPLVPSRQQPLALSAAARSM